MHKSFIGKPITPISKTMKCQVLYFSYSWKFRWQKEDLCEANVCELVSPSYGDFMESMEPYTMQ